MNNDDISYKIKDISDNDTCIIFPELFYDDDNGDFVFSFETFNNDRANAFRNLFIKNYNKTPAFSDNIYKTPISTLKNKDVKYSLINIIEMLQPEYPDSYKFTILPYQKKYIQVAEAFNYPKPLDKFYTVEDYKWIESKNYLPKDKELTFLCICKNNNI